MNASPRPTPTSEVVLKDDDLLVSKTDKKGKITYANRSFMTVSGYSELQLLGQPHSLIRHQDMPRGVFRLMWKMLQDREEFFGFVKNYCSDGRYYWVFANVTADVDGKGNTDGYFSVRRKAPVSAVQYCEKLYQQMRLIEENTSGSSGTDKSMAFLLDTVNEQYPSFNEAMMALYQQDKG